MYPIFILVISLVRLYLNFFTVNTKNCIKTSINLQTKTRIFSPFFTQSTLNALHKQQIKFFALSQIQILDMKRKHKKTAASDIFNDNRYT